MFAKLLGEKRFSKASRTRRWLEETGIPVSRTARARDDAYNRSRHKEDTVSIESSRGRDYYSTPSSCPTESPPPYEVHDLVPGEPAFSQRARVYQSAGVTPPTNFPAPPARPASPPVYFLCQLCDREKAIYHLAGESSNLEGYILGFCHECAGTDEGTGQGREPDDYLVRSTQQNPMAQWRPDSSSKRRTRMSRLRQRSSTARKPVPPPFGPTFLDRNPSFETHYLPRADGPSRDPFSQRTQQPGPSARRVHTCVICSEEYPFDEFLLPTQQCAHETDYCRQCMRRMISSDLESKGWDKIRCPEPKCKSVLSDADVLRHAPGATYSRYSDFAAKAALSAMPDFRRCLAPKCGSGQVHADDDGPLFICYACGTKMCIHHQVRWHEGDTCREYDYRMDGTQKKKEEKASEATKKKTTKACPSCQAPIEKNDGCDHMVCTKCRHEFCWECRADYEQIRNEGNAHHGRRCKFYAA